MKHFLLVALWLPLLAFVSACSNDDAPMPAYQLALADLTTDLTGTAYELTLDDYYRRKDADAFDAGQQTGAEAKDLKRASVKSERRKHAQHDDQNGELRRRDRLHERSDDRLRCCRADGLEQHADAKEQAGRRRALAEALAEAGNEHGAILRPLSLDGKDDRPEHADCEGHDRVPFQDQRQQHDDQRSQAGEEASDTRNALVIRFLDRRGKREFDAVLFEHDDQLNQHQQQRTAAEDDRGRIKLFLRDPGDIQRRGHVCRVDAVASAERPEEKRCRRAGGNAAGDQQRNDYCADHGGCAGSNQGRKQEGGNGKEKDCDNKRLVAA